MAHIHELIDFTVAAYVVHKGKVLLIHHKEQSKWLPVGGHIELHEDADEALEREIKEECGLEVKVHGQIRKRLDNILKPLRTPMFVDIHKINDIHKHHNFVYFAYAKSGKVRLAEKEHNDIRWFSRKDLSDKKFNVLPDVKFYSIEALKLLGKK